MDKTRKKINILHLRDSAWVCGPGRTILETAAFIDSSHYSYSIGALSGKEGKENPFIKVAVEKNLKVYPLEESGPFDPKVVTQVLKLIDEHHVNILHTHEFRSDFIGLICARMRRIPVVATVHGWIKNGIKSNIYTAIDKAILRFFDHIIAVSDNVKQKIIRLGIVGKKVSVLHNALVLEKFRRDPNDRSFRQEIGVNEETILIGNIGRLSPEKGQSDFLLAANEIVKHHDDVRFVLIGTGPDQLNLEELARSLGIQEQVIFAGFRTDMTRVYNSLDLVVQSSYAEGLPNVVLEALAMEVPVIATDVGGTSEILQNSEAGMLIDANDSGKLAGKIGEYLENPEEFRKLAKNGKSLIESKFNFVDRTRQLERIYEEIFSKRN